MSDPKAIQFMEIRESIIKRFKRITNNDAESIDYLIGKIALLEMFLADTNQDGEFSEYINTIKVNQERNQF